MSNPAPVTPMSDEQKALAEQVELARNGVPFTAAEVKVFAMAVAAGVPAIEEMTQDELTAFIGMRRLLARIDQQDKEIEARKADYARLTQEHVKLLQEREAHRWRQVKEEMPPEGALLHVRTAAWPNKSDPLQRSGETWYGDELMERVCPDDWWQPITLPPVAQG